MAESDGSQTVTRAQTLIEGILIVLGALFFASIAVIAIQGTAVDAGIFDAESTGSQLLSHVVQFLAFGVVVFWYLRTTDRWETLKLGVPTARQWGIVIAGTIGLLGAQIGLTVVLDAIGISTGANRAVTAGLGNPDYFLAMIVLSILLVGPAEELLFRGVVQTRLRETWGAWPAILLATVIFGVIHLPAIVGDTGQQWATIALITLLGVVLGYLYERTQNVVVPALVHGVHNAVIFGLQYLSAIGVA